MDPIGPVANTQATRPPIGQPESASADFGETFATVAANARDTLKAGEAAAISGISGDGGVQDVVQALMSAEQHLRAAIAVRDRVVAAYQEISRMQI
ncbi:MAG: flagellar hook-basal body complex protein FliE [Pseudomonadota bacterium]